MQAFATAQAMTPDRATTLESLGLSSSFVFRRMVTQAVFVETTPGHYYLDQSAAETFRKSRRVRIISFIALALVVWAVIALARG